MPAGNICSGHSSGPVLWPPQEQSIWICVIEIQENRPSAYVYSLGSRQGNAFRTYFLPATRSLVFQHDPPRPMEATSLSPSSAEEETDPHWTGHVCCCQNGTDESGCRCWGACPCAGGREFYIYITHTVPTLTILVFVVPFHPLSPL